MLITRAFEFSAAHKLNHPGPCSNLHGHNYALEITVKGEVDKQGFVIDFADIKKFVDELVLSKIDHGYLNDLLEQPTAENIAKWIWQQLETNLALHQVKLFETKDCYVTYKGE